MTNTTTMITAEELRELIDNAGANVGLGQLTRVFNNETDTIDIGFERYCVDMPIYHKEAILCKVNLIQNRGFGHFESRIFCFDICGNEMIPMRMLIDAGLFVVFLQELSNATDWKYTLEENGLPIITVDHDYINCLKPINPKTKDE